MNVVAADGPLLDRVLDLMCRSREGGLTRGASAKMHAAQMKTAWGRQRQRMFALVAGGEVLAGAAQYDLTAVLDGRVASVCGIGPVFTEASPDRLPHARLLTDTLLEKAAGNGAEIGLLFSQPGANAAMIESTDLTLSVAQSPRYGAPMTMVRGGEERDLAAIVTMGRVRAEPFRFHLDRDIDFLQYVITTKRLLAGLGSPNARQFQFFIAEEGITAAAYVILSVVGDTWTIEECGDRDPSGARVGALLQALIAREPAERRPTIHAWLPPRFLPPQVTIVSATPSAPVINVRMLDGGAILPPLSRDDVLFWRTDVFDPAACRH